MLSARRCSHLADSFRWEARRRQCRYTERGWMKARRLSTVRPTFTCSHTRRERGEFRDEGNRRRKNGGEQSKCSNLDLKLYHQTVLTYKGSPSRAFTRAKQGYCSRENTADRAMIIPYSFPKWHDGKLHSHTTTGDNSVKQKWTNPTA